MSHSFWWRHRGQCVLMDLWALDVCYRDATGTLIELFAPPRPRQQYVRIATKAATTRTLAEAAYVELYDIADGAA